MIPQLNDIGYTWKPYTGSYKGLYIFPATVNSGGYTLEKDPSYDWDGLKRGKAEYTSFQYTVSGGGMVRYEGKEHRVVPGTVLTFHFPHDHRFWLPEGWEPWEQIWASFHGVDIMHTWKIIEKQKGFFHNVPMESPLISKLIHIVRTLVTDKMESPFQAASLGFDFAMTMLDELIVKQNKSSRPDHVRRVMEFIDENLTRPIGIDDMAKVSGYSRNYFIRLFTQSEGVSPGVYLIGQRIEYASQLLRQHDSTVKEVAFKSGFPDPAYFCRMFKKKTGVSPAVFRKRGVF